MCWGFRRETLPQRTRRTLRKKDEELRTSLSMFCVLLLLPGLLLQPAVAWPNPETYKQNEDGLAKEFEAFLKAYQRGDDKGMDESFGVFRLPKAPEWFGNYFSAEDTAKLASLYDREMSDAEASLIEDMNKADPGSRFRARCEARGESAAGKPNSGEYGMRPMKAIVVEQFRLEFRSGSHDQKFSFIANFVYVDGAYRFVGGGGVPFWAKPGVGR